MTLLRKTAVLGAVSFMASRELWRGQKLDPGENALWEDMET